MILHACIRARGIELSESNRRQTHEKLDIALDLFEDDVVDIRVDLRDINGPLLGGKDKACRIVVQLRKQDSLVVEDIDESVDVVIDRVTDRLGIAASQRAALLKKKLKKRRMSAGADDDAEFYW